MDIQVENAKVDELEGILNLYQQVTESMILTGIDQWDSIYPTLEVIRSDIEHEHMFIAKINGELAGAFVLNTDCDKEYALANWSKLQNFVVLHRLCINPTFQNKGLGRKIMLWIEQFLMSSNTHSVRLDVFSQNPHALKLYDSLDYQIVRDATFRKGQFYLMEKLIKYSNRPPIS